MTRQEATPQIPQRLPPWGRFPGNRYVYTYIHMQTYTYVYIYIHVHIFTCTRMYVCVCVCVRQERTVHLKHDLQKRPIDENRENYWSGVDSLPTYMSKKTCTGQKRPPKEAGIQQKRPQKEMCSQKSWELSSWGRSPDDIYVKWDIYPTKETFKRALQKTLQKRTVYLYTSKETSKRDLLTKETNFRNMVSGV